MLPRPIALLLSTPALLVALGLMVAPMLLVVVASLMTAGPNGGVMMPWSLAGYQQIVLEDSDFDGVPDAFYWGALRAAGRTLALSAGTTIIAALLCLPAAWYIVLQPRRRQMTILLLIGIPFLTNLLIRTYALVLLMRDEGLINGALRWLGLEPLPLMYHNGAMLFGMVNTFLPFMLFPIYAALERFDRRLLEAAHDLYATRWQAFTRIVLPAAWPGVVAGSLLTFIPALGTFLVPDLLGGGRTMLLGNLLFNQFSSARNWSYGAALATCLTVLVVLAMAWNEARQHRQGARA